MVVLPSLIYLSISGLAALLSIAVSEEIVQVFSRGVAICCLILGLVSAPLLMLLILATPLLGWQLREQLQRNF
ncbi:MAG: hypothetical protein ACRC8A_09380 [Microcoleaceae cyanobacterium]